MSTEPTTTAPKPATWHYWVAFTSVNGPGAFELTLTRALTTGQQVQNIQRELIASHLPGAIVLSWTLLRTEPAATR